MSKENKGLSQAGGGINATSSAKTDKQSESLLTKVGAALIALITAGSAPFWWTEVFRPDKNIAVHLQRVGESNDCMRLPSSARIIAVTKHWPDVEFVVSQSHCDATVQVSGWRAGTFMLKIRDAGGITLNDPNARYAFNVEDGDKKPQAVLVSEVALAHVQILMLKYSGCDGTQEKAPSNLDTFKEGMTQRLLNLQQTVIDANASQSEAITLSAALSGELAYLRNAGVLKSDATAASLSDIERQWNEAKALQVLTGRCSTAETGTRLRSEVFAGRFFPQRANGLIEIDSEVRPGDLGPLKDLHLASILYALAIEAKLRGKKDELERPLLIAAFSSINTKSESIVDTQRAILCGDILASFKEDFQQDKAIPGRDACQ